MKRLMASAGLNTFAVFLLQAISFLMGIWAAKIMSKPELGALQMLRTILGYSAFSMIGVTQAILFELPVAIGKNDIAEVKRIQYLFNTLLIFTGAIAVLIFFGLGYFNVTLNGVNLGMGWTLFGLIIFLSSWTTYPRIIFQSHQQFARLGAFRITYPICFGVSGLFLLPYWRIGGFLAAMAFGYSAMAVYGFFSHKKTLGFYWDKKRLYRYVKFGLPIRMGSFVWLLITSAGLWLSSLIIGSKAGGVYGFAIMISSAYGLVPGVVGEMGMPRICSFFGRAQNRPASLIRPAKFALRAFSGLNVLIAISALASFDAIICHWIPKYIEALPLMLVLVIGYYTYNTCALAGSILNLLHKQHIVLMLNILILVVVVALGFIAAEVLGSLLMVAAATMIGLCLSGVVTVWLILRYLHDKSRWKTMIMYLVDVTSGIIIIILSWFCALQFQGWARTIVFFVTGVIFSMQHLTFGIKALRCFWVDTALESVHLLCPTGGNE